MSKIPTIDMDSQRTPIRTRIGSRWPLVAALCVALVTLSSGVAIGQGAGDRAVSVIQQKPLIRAMRVELTPTFGYTVNETMREYMQAAATLRFHITDEWSVGINYGHYFSSNQDLVDELQGEYAIFPERNSIQWFAGGDVGWSPIYGKFVLFETGIVHWDLFLTAGAGVTKTLAPDPVVTATAGLGARFYMTQWLTLTVELKDHIYPETFKAGTKIMNNLVVHSGLSIFFPFTTEYKYAK